MKYKLLLIIAVVGNLSQAQPTLPSIKTVVERFYSHYDVSSLGNPYVQFQKKKDGWYVVTLKGPNTDIQIDSSWFFYSARREAFLSLHLAKAKESKKLDYKTIISDYDDMMYEKEPCYGYMGWYKDVIKKFQMRSDLSDDELYALGRAYSVFAHILVYGDHYFTQGYEPNLPIKRNSLSHEQMSRFDSLANLGIHCFQLLRNRNPSYKTTFDEIINKYPDEVMSTFETMLLFADEQVQRWKLPHGIYSDSTIIWGMNVLKDCPKDCIFLSFGDRDYYPLLYLQQEAGYRTDVYVIDIARLGIDQYSYMITQPRLGAASISLSLDSSYYTNSNNWYLRLKQASTDIPFDSAIATIRAGVKNKNHETEILSNRFSLPIKSDSTSVNIKGIVSIDRKVLYKNEWLLLDIINNLRGRKICMLYEFPAPLEDINKFLTVEHGINLLNN